jgi:dTDP-4-amino-4,6-dideoxygalactose transaminase
VDYQYGTVPQAVGTGACEYLKVPYISLFTNGTLPLLTALQALRITGEVITTPYSFVALPTVFGGTDASRCLWILRRRLVALIPNKIEAAITPKTTAIMPVHCYGKPCEDEGRFRKLQTSMV